MVLSNAKIDNNISKDCKPKKIAGVFDENTIANKVKAVKNYRSNNTLKNRRKS